MTPDALDQREFDTLYRQHHPRVLAICRRMLGSPDQAEDAANEVFTRLPASLRSYDPEQPFARWISRVAANYCIDLLRRRSAELKVMGPADPAADSPAPAASPLHELLSWEQTETVRDALFALPERYLVPLVMRYYSDLSYDEIAATLGASRASVAVLIFRAKQRLRKSLSQPAERRQGAGQPRRRRPGGALGFPLGALAPLQRPLAQL